MGPLLANHHRVGIRSGVKAAHPKERFGNEMATPQRRFTETQGAKGLSRSHAIEPLNSQLAYGLFLAALLNLIAYNGTNAAACDR